MQGGTLRATFRSSRRVRLPERRPRSALTLELLYEIIEACSPGPYLELFARYPRDGWEVWGNEAADDVTPRGQQYPAYR